MIKVQEIRSYTKSDGVPVWELDSYFYISKPELKNDMGTWYIVGEKHSPVYHELSDVLLIGATWYNRKSLGIPIFRYKYPARILETDHKGHDCGQIYYFRHIININGVIDPEWWIYDHIAEVKAELDAVRTEDLLQEI